MITLLQSYHSFFFFILVFLGKNKAFTTHVSAERTFIRGKRERSIMIVGMLIT